MKDAIYVGKVSDYPGALSFGQTGTWEELPENPGGTFEGHAIFVPHGQETEVPYVIPTTDLHFPR